MEKTTRTISGDADASSMVTTSYVDVRGFEVSTGTMDNGVERYDTFTPDYLGNVIQYRTALDAEKNRLFTEQVEYDHAGRATKVTNALNQHTYREYDALGRNISATDRAGNTTYFEYDALGRLVKQDAPFERDSQTLAVYYASTKYYYDQAGNITREQTQNNTPGDAAAWTRTDYEYNSRNLLADVYSYDGAAIKHHAHYSYMAMAACTPRGPGRLWATTRRLRMLTTGWRRRRTAGYQNEQQRITVTHPFSPYRGKGYDVIERFTNRDEDRILCSDSDGNIRTFVTSWTDYTTDEPTNPYFGTIDFWFDDLQALAMLIVDAKKM